MSGSPIFGNSHTNHPIPHYAILYYAMLWPRGYELDPCQGLRGLGVQGLRTLAL